MNQEYVEIVKRGPVAIGEFRQENPGVVFDLAGAMFCRVDLENANLSVVDLSGADLSGANLSGANLFNANLTCAKLSGVDFSDADLSRADLSCANLSGADLARSNLTGANLFRSHLVGTDLSGANLSGASLNSAYCKVVDIGCAICGHTSFVNVDLREFRGLDTVQHLQSSDIGIRTFYGSKGQIPGLFLRGCGIPEMFITKPSSLIEKACEYYSCFISYNHEDKVFARRLHDALQDRGIRCWLDDKRMRIGDDIHHEIDRGIQQFDKVILCASISSLTSGWVDNEVTMAFAKERKLMKDRKGDKVLALIPLDLDGYLFSDNFTRGWKDIVHNRLVGDFREWKTDSKKFDVQVGRVIEALRTEREPPPVTHW